MVLPARWLADLPDIMVIVGTTIIIVAIPATTGGIGIITGGIITGMAAPLIITAVDTGITHAPDTIILAPVSAITALDSLSRSVDRGNPTGIE